MEEPPGDFCLSNFCDSRDILGNSLQLCVHDVGHIILHSEALDFNVEFPIELAELKHTIATWPIVSRQAAGQKAARPM